LTELPFRGCDHLHLIRRARELSQWFNWLKGPVGRGERLKAGSTKKQPSTIQVLIWRYSDSDDKMHTQATLPMAGDDTAIAVQR
jgi:hypothetical protein